MGGMVHNFRTVDAHVEEVGHDPFLVGASQKVKSRLSLLCTWTCKLLIMTAKSTGKIPTWQYFGVSWQGFSLLQ